MAGLRDDTLTGDDLGVLDTALQIEAQQVRVDAGRGADVKEHEPFVEEMLANLKTPVETKTAV